MLLLIKHHTCSTSRLNKCLGGRPCTPVVSRWTVCPQQGTPLQHARPVTATRLTEVPLQSHEQKKSIATVEPLGSMEWYQASDPQPQYLVVPTTAAQHSSDDSSHRSHGHGPAAVQRTVNNIVALRTTADAMDVTVLEREIGLLKQKICNTKNLEQLRGARVQALQAAVLSQGLNIPADPTVKSAAVASDLPAQQGANQSGALACKHEALLQENEALMQKCRSQSVQIQALEAVLTKAGAPLPRRSLASVSLSSYSPTSSMSSNGSLGDEDPALSTITFPAAAQSPKPPRRHTVKCHFEVKCDTAPGEKVLITGSDPALGSWQVDSGNVLLLQYSEGGIWKGDLSMEWDAWAYYSPKIMAFKAARQRIDGRIEYQHGDNLEVLVGPSMGHHVQPCVASWDFDSSNSSDKPLNFTEACMATYHINYDTEVPKEVAKRKAQQDVEKCIEKLRGNVTAAR